MRGPANTNQDSTQTQYKKHTFLKGLMPLQKIIDLFQLCEVGYCSSTQNTEDDADKGVHSNNVLKVDWSATQRIR